ncbi:hypothetical protein [Methanocaldococcus sp.]|uniref:hypothetical protein n=1 Tax=Methanocaldococcus sp. TaxID=2152917 RepID=UPI0026041B1C|nr:hypothetical protein [Methanocaldococcus sp.]MCQ6253910.1 hypothetical protein [Methanocaldococcus sp.]
MTKNINMEYVLASLTYISFIILPVLVPLIFAIIFRKNKFILFHSIQAMFIHIILLEFISLSIPFFKSICKYIFILSINTQNPMIDNLEIVFGILYLLVVITPILLGTYYSSGGKWFRFPLIGFISEKIVHYLDK